MDKAGKVSITAILPSQSRDIGDTHLGEHWKLEIYFWRCHGSNCDKEGGVSSHLLSHRFDFYHHSLVLSLPELLIIGIIHKCAFMSAFYLLP